MFTYCLGLNRTAELLTALAPSPQFIQPIQQLKINQLSQLNRTSGSARDLDADDTDCLLLAKSYFDMREIGRAAHALDGCKSVRAIFQRLYYLFLAGEKRREEAADADTPAPLDNTRNPNPHMPKIEAELAELYESGERDPFVCYLYAVVLARHPAPSQRHRAADLLLEAVHSMPCLWAAWAELASVVSSLWSGDPDEAFFARLPNHFMAQLFKVHLATEYLIFSSQPAQVHSWLDALDVLFPSCPLLTGLRAMVFYEARDYEPAESLYTSLLSNPHSLDFFDNLANVLFVMENRAKLSYLAQQAVQIDKYRRETQVVVGNYYSLRGSHAAAVASFRRALQLDRNYLAAWTLMGHEFVELKNTGEAVDAYRRAVDINPRDFRAWYGLGQAYEVLKMPAYAVYYYQRAAAIK